MHVILSTTIPDEALPHLVEHLRPWQVQRPMGSAPLLLALETRTLPYPSLHVLRQALGGPGVYVTVHYHHDVP
jgi:hypothetical protein